MIFKINLTFELKKSPKQAKRPPAKKQAANSKSNLILTQIFRKVK